MEKMRNRLDKYSMKVLFITILLSGLLLVGYAQTNIADSTASTQTIKHKDPLIDSLGKKMADYNESLALKIQLVDGYRLMLLNTTDRNFAMKVRSAIIKQYPDQKLYLTFLAPYIKLKMGNFIDKAEAEKIRKQLIEANIITGNIYLLNEKVEQKPMDKNAIPVEEQ